MTAIQLPGSLTLEAADRVAAEIEPSWARFFKPTDAAPAAERAIAPPAAKPAARPEPKASSKPSSKPASSKPSKSTSSKRPSIEYAEPSIEVPTSSTPWGKIGIGLVAVAAIVGIGFAMSGGEEPSKPDKPNAGAVVPGKDNAGDSKPAEATAKAPEPKAEEPEPKAEEPEPKAEEPEPKVEPPEPPPAAKPKPAPTPKPKATPQPPVPKPTPKPKGGGIISDVPF